MKFLFKLFLSAGMLLTVSACEAGISPTASPSPVPAGPSLHGVFEGITPCSSLTRPLPQIPADSNCEQMIWILILYQDPEAGSPTTYTLNSAYGVPQQGTMGLASGGTAITMEGKWAILTGTKLDPDAEVYQLNPDSPQTAVSFLKLNQDILHVLSSDKTLLVGNGGWSYTLNRTDNRIPGPVTAQQDPGDRFPEILAQALESSDVLVAVIGRNWIGANVEGKRRIDEEGDFVRQEVSSAIARGIFVIPVLIGGALIPEGRELPADLALFSSYNAIEVRHARFDDDAQRLLQALETALQKANERRNRSPHEPPAAPVLTPIFGITPGQSTRADVAELLENGQPQACGRVKKQTSQGWEFEYAEINVAHGDIDYTANPGDLVRSIEYWGNEPLPLGFTCTLELEAAQKIAVKYFTWLGYQSFRGLVFSNRNKGPILLEISSIGGRQNPLTYKVYGAI